MPAQISERREACQTVTEADDLLVDSAQILQFPSGAAEDPDPATALARIVQSLTKNQSGALGREIAVLAAAVAKEAPLPDADYPEGIRPRHSERCASKRHGTNCDCEPTFEASVWSTFDKKKIRKTHTTLQAAIKWRRKHLGLAESGHLRAPVKITLAEAAYTWLEKARAGLILNRSGEKYKPSALRTLEADYRLRLIPALGMHFMSDIERPDLQESYSACKANAAPARFTPSSTPRECCGATST